MRSDERTSRARCGGRQATCWLRCRVTAGDHEYGPRQVKPPRAADAMGCAIAMALSASMGTSLVRPDEIEDCPQNISEVGTPQGYDSTPGAGDRTLSAARRQSDPKAQLLIGYCNLSVWRCSIVPRPSFEGLQVRMSTGCGHLEGVVPETECHPVAPIFVTSLLYIKTTFLYA